MRALSPMSAISSMRLSVLTVVAGLSVASGCVLIAGKGEYVEYRRMRYEGSPLARAVAGQRFLEHHPASVLRGTVQTQIDRTDDALFAAIRYNERGLANYVQNFPRGRHIRVARAALDAFRAQHAAIDQAHASEIQEAEQRRHAAVEHARGFVRDTIRFFVESATSIRGWQHPIASLASTDGGFWSIWSGPPEPQCRREGSTEICAKRYERAFFVPIPGGTRRDERIELTIELRAPQGNLRSVAIDLGPEGLRRWKEMETAEAADVSTPEAETAILAWALLGMQELVHARLPNAVELPPEGGTQRWSCSHERLRVELYAEEGQGSGEQPHAASPGAPVRNGIVLRYQELPVGPAPER